MTLKNILESRKLTFYTSLVCVALVSLYVHWIPPFMVAWVVFWVAENRNGFQIKESLNGNSGKLFLLFVLLFFWQVAGVFLSESYGSGAERIIKRVSFLLFPLVLFYPGYKISDNMKIIMRTFALGIAIYVVYCFGNALSNSITVLNGVKVFYPHPPLYEYENFFYGAYFSDLVHPTYMSMFVIVSLLIALEDVLNNALSGWKRVFWLFCSFLYIIVLYLLSSRAGLLSGIIIIPLYLFFRLSKKLPRYIIYLSIIVLVFGSIVLLKTNSRIYYSFEEIKKENIKSALENNVRFDIWKSAFGVIRHNFLFGVGTGDASSELKKEFLNRGYKDGYYDNMNSHNQFIEILLENGLIGLLIFLMIIGFIAYISITEQNLILGLFLLMMIVFFMFETLLNRLAGITFFPLFTFLLLHYKSQSMNEKGHL